METLTLPATLDSLEPISNFITNAASQAGLDDHTSWQVQLAVDEAATNIIQHGYDPQQPGEIALNWRVEAGAFVVTLCDQGRRFDPTGVMAPDLTAPLDERQAGGLGIYLMGQLMDSVEFGFDDQHGNLLIMTKRLKHGTEEVQIFEISGRLDAVSTPAAIAPTQAAIAAGARFVLLDMAQVGFLSSSGLRALLLVRKQLIARDGQLRLCALQSQVQGVFTLTGFTQIFAIHGTRAEALAAFGQEQV
jgi:serine/threonine-protein kinase RsbW